MPSPGVRIPDAIQSAREQGLDRATVLGIVQDALDEYESENEVREVRDLIYDRLVGEGCPFLSVSKYLPLDSNPNALQVVTDVDDGYAYRITIERATHEDPDPETP